MSDIFKRADLLGISVYDLLNNYIGIFDNHGCLHGFAAKDDIDTYFITHATHVDNVRFIDLSIMFDVFNVYTYEFLEHLLEGHVYGFD